MFSLDAASCHPLGSWHDTLLLQWSTIHHSVPVFPGWGELSLIEFSFVQIRPMGRKVCRMGKAPLRGVGAHSDFGTDCHPPNFRPPSHQQHTPGCLPSHILHPPTLPHPLQCPTSNLVFCHTPCWQHIMHCTRIRSAGWLHCAHLCKAAAPVTYPIPPFFIVTVVSSLCLQHFLCRAPVPDTLPKCSPQQPPQLPVFLPFSLRTVMSHLSPPILFARCHVVLACRFFNPVTDVNTLAFLLYIYIYIIGLVYLL